MGDTWITDIRHFLNDDGELSPLLPNQAMNIALYICSIVEWVTILPYQDLHLTNVACRRSPGRKRCAGAIHAYHKHEDGSIVWYCPTCHDNGAIYGWQDTLWDRRFEFDWSKFQSEDDTA